MYRYFTMSLALLITSTTFGMQTTDLFDRSLYTREHQFWHTDQTRFPQFINYFYKLLKYAIQDVQTTLSIIPQPVFDLIAPENQHKNDIAFVRHTQQDELCKQELEFLDNRDPYIKKGIKKLLGDDIQLKRTPRIGLCFSGGSFRSMLMTLGFLQAAEEIGLLDATTYIASLSGSSWALGPWIASGKPLNTFKKDLAKNIKNGLNQIDNPEELRLLLCNLLGKIQYKQCISAMDIYGAVLVNTLLNDMGKKRLSMTLSDSHKNVVYGGCPLPIYTAIQTNSNPYEWMEVTPFEVGSPFLQAYVPTWAYGRKFENGISVDIKPEQTLGYFLGIFGSAFEVNLNDLLRRTTTSIGNIKSSLPDFFGPAIDKVINNILYSPLNNFRLFPSMLQNFTYKASYSPIKEDTSICLVDAGIDFNLPVPPLLRKNRNLDIIIIYDASENIEHSPELRHALEYAQRKGIKLPSVDVTITDKNHITIFKDEESNNTPIIVYIPRLKNINFSESFDPATCIKEEYCGIFNFSYSEELFNDLSGLAGFTLKQNADVIKNLIQDVVNRTATA